MNQRLVAVHTDPHDPGSTADDATTTEATAIAVRRPVGR